MKSVRSKKSFWKGKNRSDDKFKGALVDRRYYFEITSHYLMNLSGSPLASSILAIEGPPGEGKTFQLEVVMHHLGVPYRTLNASQLSGQHEGDGLLPVTEAYEALSEEADDQQIGCLIIDDFDLSPAGRKEKTEYSVNSQLLTAFLMGIADNPEICRGVDVNRSAIYLTGNNFSLLHGPLTRKGRCRFFSWQPTVEQKTAILARILSNANVKSSERMARTVLKQYPNVPISTYRAALEEICFVSIRDAEIGKRHFKREVLKKFLQSSLSHLQTDDFLSAIESIRTAGNTDYLSGA